MRPHSDLGGNVDQLENAHLGSKWACLVANHAQIKKSVVELLAVGQLGINGSEFLVGREVRRSNIVGK